MGALLGPNFPSEIALAVSGGGDSMAMLHLAAGWARIFGITLKVITVDHGLRPESTAEAAMVAAECDVLGLRHATLTWTGWDGTGNLQDAARQARLDQITAYCAPRGHVVMAHTQDDQAETVLMRLIRGSGVDGLAGMAAKRETPGLTIVRPLLGVRREALRHYCKTLKIPFVDDPSNEDARFDRVRIRRLIGQEGLDVATLAKTARQMARAKVALDQRVKRATQAVTTVGIAEAGYVAFDRDALATVEEETRLRIVANALTAIGGNPYRPRLSALESAVDQILSGGATTLHGCVMQAANDQILICREVKAIGPDCATDHIWDGRWAMSGPHAPELRISAIKDALSQCPEWRETGHPRAALMASPAIWQDERLIAAPLAGLNAGWTARFAAKTV